MEYLRGKGVTAASISSCTEAKATLIERERLLLSLAPLKLGSKANDGEECSEILCIPKNYVP